jgi:N-acetylglucosamine-6-phosphate deacetylase
MTTSAPQVWLCPDQLFDGVNLRRGLALGVSNGRSTVVHPVADLPPSAPRRLLAGTLTPGFLDLQVNGGGDALLNATPTHEAMRIMAAAHRRFGTVGILPTVITDAPDVLAAAVEAVLAAQGGRGILGLHIEGPHLSQARRGTHSSQWVRPFEAATLAKVKRLRAAGVFVKITVAPEAMAAGQIAALVATGAVVSIGHSDATAAVTRAALSEGASCFTHLFNAMSPMQNREPGVTGAAINSTAYAGIICDGHHVADEMIGLALRARPVAGRMFLVSDSMSTVGGSDRFMLYGQEIRLVNGRLMNAEGSLAGAHVTMAEGLERLITVLGIVPEVALSMAVSAPANLIRQSALASPEARDLADLVLLNDRWKVSAVGAELVPGLAA